MPLIALAVLIAPLAQEASAAAPAPADAKPAKKICRVYGTTGTIMGGKRECHTRAEWASIDGTSQAGNDRLHDAMTNAGRSNY